VTIRRIPRAKAFVELTRNTFNTLLTDSDRIRGQFGFAALLASRVSVCSLSYPPGFEHLPRVVERVLDHASRES
jgi:hypothetical protein